ncbi:periplasmic heavy metal sensor [Aliiroseovarius sp. CAU 1755]
MSADQTHTPNVTPPTKPRKWPRILLAVSLTFNLLVLGLVVGAKLGDHRDHGFDTRGPDRGAIRDLGFGPLAGALDREDRRKIGRALRDRSGSFEDNRKSLERDFQSMLDILRADAFAPEALAGLMVAQSDRLRDRGSTLRELVVERLGAMSTEERRAFADRLERSVRRHTK